MKLSLNWIFDHIASTWQEHDIPALMNRFTTTTAEIEHYEFIKIDLDSFTLVTIVSVGVDSVTALSEELQQEIVVPLRASLLKDQLFLLKKNKKQQWAWAQASDFTSQKEGLLPEFFVSQEQRAGSWKDHVEQEDYVITLSNTSITHRPDLWCHRGFAREIAAILGCQLKSERHFLSDYPIAQKTEKSRDNFIFERQTEKCKRFAALSLAEVSYTASLIPMAHRLLRVDSRPINAIVDTTNYVMFDIGQPMHAFDASKLSGKKLMATQAQAGQTLTLLDEQTIALSPENTVICDDTKPLALAGIMGGLESSVTPTTRSLVIEAANFDAAAIRATAHAFKLRTESSTRFEKSLDPLQVTTALVRFLHLLEKNKISFVAQGDIVCLGDEIKPHSFDVMHHCIEKKLGVKVDHEFVLKTLTNLGFDVRMYESKEGVIYKIQVPSWRATKDVSIAEDIIEEVGRFFGFEKIPYELPMLALRPHEVSLAQKVYELKKNFALQAPAREMCNYALYDEEFLASMQWEPDNALRIKNPVSEHMSRLVTSLVPNLFKNIVTNHAQEDVLNFFEWNKIWVTQLGNAFSEYNSFAGIFFDGKSSVDFYHKKYILSALLRMLGINLEWLKTDACLAPWYHPYKTATLLHEGTVVGFAGSVNPGFLGKFLTGDAFIFELNGDLLFEIPPQKIRFTSLPKYQDTWRDISMLAPLAVTVAQLSDTILKVSPLIFDVELIDFFQKEDWADKRSVTLRFFARDEHKTLSSDDIDDIYNCVLKVLAPLKVEIR